jgi:hypothetical protein
MAEFRGPDEVVLTGEEWGEIVDALGLPAVNEAGEPDAARVATEARRLVAACEVHPNVRLTAADNRAVEMAQAIQHLEVALEKIKHWRLPRTRSGGT